MTTPAIPNMRSSVRFPLRIPVALRTEQREHKAQTSDISAGGVLMTLEAGLPVGTPVEFTLEMPARMIGSAKDVLVNCVGRVVRCSRSDDGCAVAAVIDDYRFIR